MKIRFIAAPLISLAIACGGSGSEKGGPSVADPTAPFAGTWIYQSGSAIVADCPGAPEQTIDLSNVPIGHEEHRR